MDRLAMLRKMAAAKPEDPFPAYGLAMELNKTGAQQEAKAAFEALVQQHPDYVPSYLMFGNLLVGLGDRQAAVQTYDAGIAAADRAGDAHARSELEAARDEAS